jgi:hypothetical protein
MIAEAAALDLPVLTTGWSAPAEYLKKDWVTFFDYDMVDVPQQYYAQGLFQPGMKWASPRQEDIKRKLRRCHDGYSVAKAWAVEQGQHVRENWSKSVTDKKLVDTFLSIVNPQTIALPPGLNMQVS